MTRRAAAPLALGLAAALSTGHALADNPAEVFELPAVTVIGTTPLPGLGTAPRDVPANVQIFGSRELSRQRPRDLTEFLDRNANSIGVASGQGNSYQQDLNFRGFAASPLLGTPQGISVFQDSVRINEAFGDVVNWDLLPSSAISSVQLIPGSNPVFGLNTLGGALAIYTKSGTQYPGGSIELSAGAFGRKSAEFEYGGNRDRIDYFVTGNFAEDSGWADHNPSRVKQLFGKIGYQDDRTDLDLSATLADNTLQGTQTLPQAWLDTREQAYTFPDTNRNRLAFVAAKGSRFLSPVALLGGSLYYRHFRNTNVSSNVNAAFGEPDPATGQIQTNEATNDRSGIDQRSWGLGLQLTLQGELAGRSHQLVIGASGDFGETRFDQQSQPASFTPERNTIATGDFAPTTDVGTRNRYVGVFAADTLALDERWTLTLAGRYNRARIDVGDRSGRDSRLDSRSTFARFNPAIGLNYNPVPDFTGYAAYNEGMRAPSPVELTCANAAAPCKLPNIFLSDPPLKQVVSRTVELGARGTLGPAAPWSAALYRTDLDNDIQFIAAGEGALNAGFFRAGGKQELRRALGEYSLQPHRRPVPLAVHGGEPEQLDRRRHRSDRGRLRQSDSGHTRGYPETASRSRPRCALVRGRKRDLCIQPIRARRREQSRPPRPDTGLYRCQSRCALPGKRGTPTFCYGRESLRPSLREFRSARCQCVHGPEPHVRTCSGCGSGCRTIPCARRAARLLGRAALRVRCPKN